MHGMAGRTSPSPHARDGRQNFSRITCTGWPTELLQNHMHGIAGRASPTPHARDGRQNFSKITCAGWPAELFQNHMRGMAGREISCYKYRWVSYKKMIRSIGNFFVETVFYRSSCRRNKFYFTMFSLLCGRLNLLTRISTFLVSKFWRLELFVPRRFVAGLFWRYNILPPKNKSLIFWYDIRDSFLRNFPAEFFSIW